MIVRTGSGWQYILADLSLILFMVTAAALASSDNAPAHTPTTSQPIARARSAGTRPLSPQAEPLALYRSAPGAPSLGQWLHQQSADSRQQLTIVAHYAPGGQVEALSQAAALARDAGEAGALARIVVEPGQGGASATLAFDIPEAAMARDLHESGRSH
jgi:hypothetical protein